MKSIDSHVVRFLLDGNPTCPTPQVYISRFTPFLGFKHILCLSSLAGSPRCVTSERINELTCSNHQNILTPLVQQVPTLNNHVVTVHTCSMSVQVVQNVLHFGHPGSTRENRVAQEFRAHGMSSSARLSSSQTFQRAQCDVCCDATPWFASGSRKSGLTIMEGRGRFREKLLVVKDGK